MMKKGKALHVLVSVCVLNNKPVGSMADTALFSLAFLDYVCVYPAAHVWPSIHFLLQPGVTEMAVGMGFCEKMIWNGREIS